MNKRSPQGTEGPLHSCVALVVGALGQCFKGWYLGINDEIVADGSPRDFCADQQCPGAPELRGEPFWRPQTAGTRDERIHQREVAMRAAV